VLPARHVCVTSCEQLIDATISRAAVAYIDMELIEHVGEGKLGVPAVAIIEPSAEASTVSTAIHAFDRYPWLAHVIAAPLLETPHAAAHLATLLERLCSPGTDHHILGAEGKGRVALLARASRRDARFERMREYFVVHGQSPRTISALVEVAEELVMNALYDAPVEGGYFTTPRQRDTDVELPVDLACEISYGFDNGCAFVRVRDPFGALERDRLLDVLTRCSGGSGVALDESRGGAGLGLWRVCTMASTLAISVIPGALTDIFVTVAPRDRRSPRQLQACHLFFGTKKDDSQALVDDDGLIDQSVTLVLVA
jgi:hypothetical protein